MSRLPAIFGVLSTAALALSAGLIFGYAPTEATMGVVQKIFYIHVPSAWAMYFNWFICAIASAIWIVRKSERWDLVAASAGENALLFAAGVMITGPLWGRSIWSAYWAWDPRLTSALILTCIIAAYVLLRASQTRSDHRFAAVLAISGAVMIPAIHFSIQIWRGQHPVVLGRGGAGITGEMALTLIICTLAFTLLSVAFLLFGTQNKRRQRQLHRATEALRHADTPQERARICQDLRQPRSAPPSAPQAEGP
ncbi:MAG: cytochrome c biogenesis protein [Proteobacteria bacterium]|nr:cytochrome c biogenesis protein [Pseudomonadota bacterium]NLN61402.1 cytochrome c biogenesis protein CcsA [Myxococcales bacterium]